MRRSRFTNSRIMEISKRHAAGVPTLGFDREHNGGMVAIQQCFAKFSGMESAPIKRSKDGSYRECQAQANVCEGPYWSGNSLGGSSWKVVEPFCLHEAAQSATRRCGPGLLVFGRG